MIEFSYAELFLLAWAITATFYAYTNIMHRKHLSKILFIIMEDEEERNKIIRGWKQAHER